MTSKMKVFICNLLLVVALCTERDLATSDQCEASNDGTSFIFGIIGFHSPYSGMDIYLHITTTELSPAHVRVTAPFINFNNSYTVSNYTFISLNGTLSQYETGKQFKGIEVNSDVNISLAVVTGKDYEDIVEGFLALPVNALGTRYIAASYYPWSSGNYSEILVAGVESDTNVILSTKLNGHIGFNRTFRLQKFETYQFQSNNDVSGSIITSNKPVAVFSGSADAQVPLHIGDRQYLVEQMIPTKYWTTTFIIPPIYPRLHFVLKVFANDDNTAVHFYNSARHIAVFLKKGSMEELLLDTNPVIVLADKPISVVQYGHDGDNMIGDPFMTNGQGMTQFQSSYKFATQNIYSTGSNTIAITVLKNSTSRLLLNGHSMTYWNARNVSVAHPMEEYVTLFVNVSYNSFFKLYHSDGIKFGAVLYGRITTNIGYGYPLRLSLNDKDCKTHTAVFTTTSVTTDTTTVSAHGNQSIYQGNGTWCFQCDGMTHLQYCDKVAQCRNTDEVCYVQRYTRSFDVNLYKSGCINRQTCHGGNDNGDCLECCNGNFCNSAGCGDTGFQSLGQRGPLCFDCSHKGEHETCNTLQLCDSSQACMIERYKWGDNNFHYLMGCTHAQICATKRSVNNKIATRHAPVCAHCCHSDFCNMNCTSIETGPSIVG